MKPLFRHATCLILTVLLLLTAALPQQPQTGGTQARDLSKAVVDSNLARFPDAAKFGNWGYAKALFLLGQYLVYKRTHDPRYLEYIKTWVDQHLDKTPDLAAKINSLDYHQPSNLILILWQETHDPKYKAAAEIFRRDYDVYPRTSDGGFFHAKVESRQHQLWADGVYMGLPFLVRYGQLFGDAKYANDEAAKQLIIYGQHLKDPAHNLLYHAYDESGKQAWADPVSHHSSEFWARAIGWYAMTLVEVLDVLPKNHPRRKDLIANVQFLAKGFARYQDPSTGLWYQVVDKGSTPGNWQETSASCMYIYMLSVGVKRGYLPKKYQQVAEKGYRGVLSKVTFDSDGLANISDISEGTNVGDLAFYFARKRPVNDPHGLGAFLIMNEEFTTGRDTMQTMGYAK